MAEYGTSMGLKISTPLSLSYDTLLFQYYLKLKVWKIKYNKNFYVLREIWILSL